MFGNDDNSVLIKGVSGVKFGSVSGNVSNYKQGSEITLYIMFFGGLLLINYAYTKTISLI